MKPHIHKAGGRWVCRLHWSRKPDAWGGFDACSYADDTPAAAFAGWERCRMIQWARARTTPFPRSAIVRMSNPN
jgi:hypothetical protein